jgi:nuclear cap-binding protein subunit 1
LRFQYAYFYAVPRPHLAFEAKLATCQSYELGPLTCPDPPQSLDKSSLSAFGKHQQEAEKMFPRRNRRIQIFPSAKTDEVSFTL